MSRRPGIGHDWIKKWNRDTYPSDSVIINGVERKPPKYYDREYEFIEPEAMKKIKKERIQEAEKKELTQEKLEVMEKVHRAKIELFKKRRLENDKADFRNI